MKTTNKHQLIEGLNNTYIVSVVVNGLRYDHVYPKNATSLGDDSYKQLCIADAKNKYSKEGSNNDN